MLFLSYVSLFVTNELFEIDCLLIGFNVSYQMVGKADGLNLIGRKMRTRLGSGITHLVNGLEMPMIKVALSPTPF